MSAGNEGWRLSPTGPQPVQLAEGLIKALSAASRTLRLYPEASTLPLQAVRNFHGLITEALAQTPFMSVGVAREHFSYQGHAFGQDNDSLKAFATDLYSHQIRAVIFRSGVNEREILELLRLLALDALLVREQGGMAAMLMEQQVSGLMVDEIELRLVDEEQAEGATTRAVAMGLVDDVSQTAVDAVEHFFVSLSSSVPEMVAWLRSISPALAGDGQSPADNILEAVRQLGASIATSTELPQEQAIYFRNIAEGIMALDEPLRADVVCGRMVPGASASTVFAKILSQFSEAELAELLASSAESDLAGTRDLIGDLSFLGNRQEEVVSMLESMLFERGHSSDDLETLKAALKRSPEERAPRALPEEVVAMLLAVSEYTDGDLKVIESVNESSSEQQTDLSALKIRTALLSEAQEENEYLSLLEGLGPLSARIVKRGDIGAAASALDWSLTHARSTLKVWPSVSDAIRALGETVGSSDVIDALVQFLRQRSAERDVRAVSRYVALLPDLSVEFLVDALSNERSMAVRKRLCAVLSETGRKAVHVLGTKLGDPRWYLVRNVVSVFGMMRDRAALPFLETTAVHADPRVRAETVRALGMIRDESAAPWLVDRLGDTDVTVRVAAARWLGRLKARDAVPALCQVAESRSAADVEVTKVAIQALSQIGDESARPTLQRLASRKGLLRRKRVREIKSLAADALAAMSEAEAEVQT